MRRFICLLALLFALLLAVFGCVEKSDRENGTMPEMAEEEHASSYSGFRNTVLYYETDDGLMAPVMRQIPWEEGIGRAALEYLVDDSENRKAIAPYGLHAPIPAGTHISLRIDDASHARVELSDFPVESLPKSAYNMVAAIVNTLTEFPAIKTVSVMANGAPIGKLTGEAFLCEALSPFALNAEDGSVPTSTGQSHAMTLYFPNRSGSLLIPVTRYCEDESDFSAAVQALIDGPKTEGLISCFPVDTALLEAKIENGAASVDLSSEYGAVEEVEGLCDLAYESLLLTAQAYGEAAILDVLVEGTPYAMDAVSTLAPLYANQME